MYPVFFKNMSGGKGNCKEQKMVQKQINRNSNASDIVVHNKEIVDLKSVLMQFKKSVQHFKQIVAAEAAYSIRAGMKNIHVGLIELLDTLKNILDKHPRIATPEVYAAVHMLVKYLQSNPSDVEPVETDKLANQVLAEFYRSASQSSLRLRDSAESSPIDVAEVHQAETAPDEVPLAENAKNNIFGVDLQRHIVENNVDVPFIITKCINEIESRGFDTSGLYRVSASTSKFNKLCNDFEKFGNNIVCKDDHPNTLANVLKSYFRRLPEPLFTFDLYPEFVNWGKSYSPPVDEEQKRACADQLRAIVVKLPPAHYRSAYAIFHHLHRVAKHQEENLMSAYNLAVVFGPTLLQSKKSNSNVNLPHQIKAVEMMITWAESVFDSIPPKER